MLPVNNRVRSERDFKRVYQKGSFFSLRFFNVNYAPNRLSNTRIGFVVNKKTAKSAVVRNKIKRRFREEFRSLYETMPSGYDVIVNLKREAIGAGHKEALEEARKAIERIKR